MGTNAGALFWLAGSLLASTCSSPSPDGGHVRTSYDTRTGRLTKIVVNAERDGKPDISSYMDGSRFIRIEIDKDEDGKIDRWEYYGADQKLEKVGLSRPNDGVADTWLFQSSDGTIARTEIATRRDGKPNRFEFYEKGLLVRVEQDSDGDGRIDRWETHKDGALTTASFDTKGTGSPDTTIQYQDTQEGPGR